MRTSIRLATLLALVLALVPSITASAGTPVDPNLGDTILGKAGGVRYASDPAAYDAMSSFAEVEVGCGGPRWHLIGGGSAAGGADPLKWDAASRPYDYDDPDTLGDDGWLAQGFGPSGSEVTGYSICVRDGDLSYPIKTIADSPTGSRTGYVSCGGARWQVTNGSAFIATTGSWVQSSFPKDGRDADTVPGDGWKGTVYDAIGGTGSFGMYAVCAAGVDLSYVRGTPATLVAGSGAITRKVACRASEHVVGGGAKWSGPADKARLASSFPYDGPDVDDVPDDGWQTRPYGMSGADKTVTPFAICLG
jgi:hypothetical protein